MMSPSIDDRDRAWDSTLSLFSEPLSLYQWLLLKILGQETLELEILGQGTLELEWQLEKFSASKIFSWWSPLEFMSPE